MRQAKATKQRTIKPTTTHGRGRSGTAAATAASKPTHQSRNEGIHSSNASNGNDSRNQPLGDTGTGRDKQGPRGFSTRSTSSHSSSQHNDDEGGRDTTWTTGGGGGGGGDHGSNSHQHNHRQHHPNQQPQSLHWTASNAFHAALWTVLQYAGPALAPVDLWVWRSLLQQLTRARNGIVARQHQKTQQQRPASPLQQHHGAGSNANGCEETGAGASAKEDEREEEEEDEEEEAVDADAPLWECSDEIELLLRLSLRRLPPSSSLPVSFTLKEIESRYGEELKVHAALRALEAAELLHWHEAPPRKQQQQQARREMVASPMVRRYTGAHLAALITALSPRPQQQQQQQQQQPTRPSSDATHATPTGGGGIKRARDTPRPTSDPANNTNSSSHSYRGMDPRRRVPLEGELLGVLQAVRATDLRHCAATMHRCCAAYHQQRQQKLREKKEQQRRQQEAAAAAAHGNEEAGMTAVPVAGHCDASSDSVVALSSAELPPPPPPPKATTEPTAAAAAAASTRANASIITTTAAAAAGDDDAEEARTAAAQSVPNRRRDLIVYLIERRYLEITTRNSNNGSAGGDDSAANAPPPPRRRPRRGGGAAPTATATTATPATAIVVVDMTAVEERDLFHQCWSAVIGDCLTVERAVCRAVASVAELFLVLTGNFGAGGALSTMASNVNTGGGGGYDYYTPAAAYTATAPTLLMLPWQLRLLMRYVRCVLGTDGSDRGCGGGGGVSFHNLISGGEALAAPSWWWSMRADAQRLLRIQQQQHQLISYPSSSTQALSSLPALSPTLPSPPQLSFPGSGGAAAAVVSLASYAGKRASVILHHDADALVDLRRSLATYRAVYDITTGATTIGQKLRARDTAYILSLYAAITEELTAPLRDPARRRSILLQQVAAAAVGTISTASTGSSGGGGGSGCVYPNVHAVLRRHGLRAQHLLQFTAAYRWCASLDLLYPLLQSARRYEESNACLRLLVDTPVYTVYPAATTNAHAATSSSSSLPAVSFPIFYRPQKRGEWQLRLAMNLTHLGRKDAALELLSAVHGKWRAAWLDDNSNSDTSDAKATATPTATATASGGGGMRALLAEVLDAASVGGGSSGCDGACCCCCSGGYTVDPAYRTAAAATDRRERQAALIARMPVALQRRARLLRAIWPEKEDNQDDDDEGEDKGNDDEEEKEARARRARRQFHASFTGVSRAVYHVVTEHQLSGYLRRADALAIEHALCAAHRSLRRWTPLPPRYSCLTAAVCEGLVPQRRLDGQRDAMEGRMWLEPGVRGVPAMPVEDFVMEHYLREWNARDKNTRANSSINIAVPSSTNAAGRRNRQPSTAGSFVSISGDDDDNDDNDGDEEHSARRNHTHIKQNDDDDGDDDGGEDNKDEEEEEEKVDTWRGRHCEGAWIAYTARVLLWDCFQHPLTTQPPLLSDTAAAASTTATSVLTDPECLWLSPFQEGPLDLLAPLEFTARRRRLLESRIAYFERNPGSVMLAYAASRIAHSGGGGGGGPTSITTPTPTAAAVTVAVESPPTPAIRTDDGINEECDVPLFEGDDNSYHHSGDDNNAADAFVSLAQAATASQGPATTATAPTTTPATTLCPSCDWAAALTATVPDELRLYTRGFPLMDLLRAVPRRPLLRLLRCLYLSDPAEGFSPKFSGFPDLVLWRRRRDGGADPDDDGDGDDDDDDHAKSYNHASTAAAALTARFDGRPVAARPPSECFRLIEVKSPSDTLSTKQIAMNDCLLRCGFDVSVGHVVDVAARAQRVAVAALGRRRRDGGGVAPVKK